MKRNDFLKSLIGIPLLGTLLQKVAPVEAVKNINLDLYYPEPEFTFNKAFGSWELTGDKFSLFKPLNDYLPVDNCKVYIFQKHFYNEMPYGKMAMVYTGDKGTYTGNKFHSHARIHWCSFNPSRKESEDRALKIKNEPTERFRYGFENKAKPEWHTASGDGITDDKKAIDAAIKHAVRKG